MYSIACAEISFFIFSINFISYIPYADQDGVRESRSPLENSYLFKLNYKIAKKYAEKFGMQFYKESLFNFTKTRLAKLLLYNTLYKLFGVT